MMRCESKYLCWFWVIVALVLTSQRSASADEGENPQDGFCGFYAAQATATRCGVAWEGTEQAKVLEDLPIVSFSQIADALHSLDLKTQYILLDNSNLKHVQHLMNESIPRVTAIAWLGNVSNGNQSSLENTGHFVCALGFNQKGELTLHDTETNVLSAFPLQNYRTLPVLLVSTSEIPEVSSRVSWSMRFRNAFSTLTTSVAMLTLCAMILMRAQKRTTEPISQSQGDRRRFRWWIAGAIAALLILPLVWIYGFWKTTPSVDEGGEALKLFSQRSFDLGDVVVGAVDPITVSITNPTDKSIDVTRLYASCGCIEVEPTQVSLAPSQTAPVTLRLTTFRAGENQYKLFAENNSNLLDSADLVFFGRELATLVPRRKMMGVLATNSVAALEQRLTIRDYKGPALGSCNVRPTSPESPLVLKLVADEGISANSEMVLFVSLKPGTHVRGIHHEDVIFDLAPQKDSPLEEQLHLLFTASVEIVP